MGKVDKLSSSMLIPRTLPACLRPICISKYMSPPGSHLIVTMISPSCTPAGGEMRAFSQRGSLLTVTSIRGSDMFAERVGVGLKEGGGQRQEGGRGGKGEGRREGIRQTNHKQERSACSRG